MKLNQIQTLIAIAETGSIRAAARKMGLTQPALSKNLKSLEDELGLSLLHRSARGVSLTPYGQAVVTRGRGITLEMDRLRDDIEQMRGAQEGSVSLAVSPSPAVLLLPAVLKRFQQSFPDVQVTIRESVYPDTLQLLREGLADLAVGAQPPIRKTTTAEFVVETLYENKLVVTCRTGHPRARATSLTELLDCEWLLNGPSEGPGSLYAPVFKANGLPLPRPRLLSNSFISSLGILEHSDALCLLPERLITHLAQAGRLMALKLREPMPDWDVCLITRAQTPLTPVTQKMVQMFRRTAPLSMGIGLV